MAGNAAAAAQVANVIIQDYLDNGPESAYCQYLELVDEGPGGWNPFIGFARQRFCQPPPPPPRPAEEFFDSGGVPCRSYRVVFETGSPGGPFTSSEVIKQGPIGTVKRERVNPDGSVNKQFYLTSGNGLECPRLFDTMAGTSDARFVDVVARIISIEPVDPDGGPDLPVWRPPNQEPPRPFPGFNVEIDLNVDGVDVNAPITFGPVVNTVFGPTIQFSFAPTANFNPQIDIDLGLNPQFGLDVDLQFVIPFTGTPNYPTPAPNAEPIPLPPPEPVGGTPCEEFDYERIEDYIDGASCCKPVEESDFIGSFVFETASDVYRASVPDNAEYVVITVVPDENSRRYKLAGIDSEIALGNASITSGNHALGYEKIFTRRHILKVPPNCPGPGIRVSLKQGCQISVEALLHAV